LTDHAAPSRPTTPARSPLAVLNLPLIGLIVAYQHTLGLLIGGRCRFHPTCSAYALEAYRTHDGLTATWLAARRLARCHPLGGHGVDPVPEYRRGPGNGPGEGGASEARQDARD